MQRREQRTIVDGIDFERVFKFPLIITAITNSMQPARLLIGFVMVIVLMATGRLWDSLAPTLAIPLGSDAEVSELTQQRQVVIALSGTILGNTAPDNLQTWSVQDAQSHLLTAWSEHEASGSVSRKDRDEFEKLYLDLESIRPLGPFESSASFVSSKWNAIVDAALNLDAVGSWQGVVSIVWELPQLLWNAGHHWFISVYGFILLLVISVGGGSIARMQACQHARGDRLSVKGAVQFSTQRWRASLLALTAPGMLVAGVSIGLVLFGLLLFNVPVLNLIGSILYGVALLFGLLIAIVAVGYAICWPMLVPAVAVENCEGGESVQRSFAYMFARPLHLLGYLVVLVVGLVLGFIIVRLISTMTLDFTANLVDAWAFNQSLGNAGAIQTDGIPALGLIWYESAASGLVTLWETVVHDFMIGWLFSGFFSSSVMVYLLMRHQCDRQDTHDIWWDGTIVGSTVAEP
ncbi:MAG: hypothetical protein HOC93_07680 [Phycisphaerae bacterium]|jgi:hypothetical protein|nr:hypothetical protein [Phycisphaerae bacterium]HJN71330.1 hypothetical protein [Phycisphaerales bacterium]